MASFKVAHLEDIEELNDGRCPYRAVRHHLGISSFGVNSWTAKDAGDRIINEHDESEQDSDEELYLVLSGRARFELDGENVDAPTGTFVLAGLGVNRTAFAEEAGTTVIVMGGRPGKVYYPHGWEVWAPFTPLYEAGKYAEAADRARELIDGKELQYPQPLFNLACCESLAGRPADAIEHLRRAIELAGEWREYAKADSDFDAIRDDPAFRELVG